MIRLPGGGVFSDEALVRNLPKRLWLVIVVLIPPSAPSPGWPSAAPLRLLATRR